MDENPLGLRPLAGQPGDRLGGVEDVVWRAFRIRRYGRRIEPDVLETPADIANAGSGREPQGHDQMTARRDMFPASLQYPVGINVPIGDAEGRHQIEVSSR